MNTLPMIIKSRFLCPFYLKVKCSLHLFTVDHATQKKKKNSQNVDNEVWL